MRVCQLLEIGIEGYSRLELKITALELSGGMDMLVDELVDYGRKTVELQTVADIRIGLGYTAVQLENGGCGLAYTLHEQEYESCSVIPDAGKLAGRKALEFIPWMKSPDHTACAVGLATLNATLATPVSAVESDILDLLPVGPEDAVGMVGYFGPLVEPIKKRVRTLYIFERKPEPEFDILPESAALDILPKCQVVIISATAILNHTINGLLDLSKNAREIAILGPSTPFIPEIFSGYGVTLLSGIKIIDPSQALRIVSEGGGTRQFIRACRKLSLRLAA
jgi:uncharacterized protein (DUF4213/DUF364 family)